MYSFTYIYIYICTATSRYYLVIVAVHYYIYTTRIYETLYFIIRCIHINIIQKHYLRRRCSTICVYTYSPRTKSRVNIVTFYSVYSGR